MLEWLIPLLIASVLGFLAGMGVGGGSLLLLWLTQVADMQQPQARIMNLLFYLPAAFTATFFYRKQKMHAGGVLLPAILAGCTAAAGFSLLSSTVDIKLMKKLLGGLLLLIGIREVFYRPRKAK